MMYAYIKYEVPFMYMYVFECEICMKSCIKVPLVLAYMNREKQIFFLEERDLILNY